MLSVAFLNRLNYFYPVGNTPAVTLTALLPPNQPAKLLSLGCGDLRHLLFTIHDDGRAIDFTCCDLQPAILARNVLLLSLILDDKDGKNYSNLWDIYFHFKISEDSLEVLHRQTHKVCSLAESLQKWHTSEYGGIVKFCDEGSLRKVREIWAFYSNATQNEFRVYIQRCQKLKASRGSEINITSMNSLGPAILKGSKDIPTAHDHYWKHGTTSVEQKAINAATQFNPCFVTLDKDVVLHYGVDPLTGFHLATAYLPLEKSGVDNAGASSQGLGRLVGAAKSEFRDWMSSFREQSPYVVIRCFVGDALAFAHLLQQQQDVSTLGELCFYRDRSHFDPVSLDHDGDDLSQDLNSRRFDIIDTSNLADHIGALNLFTSVRPLLKDAPWATIYTETLLVLEHDHKKSLDGLLCGKVQTISVLTGLVPAEVVTNTSTSSSDARAILDMTRNQAKQAGKVDQQLCRLTWKLPLLPADADCCTIQKTSFSATDFANLIHSIFLKMFEGEDLTTLMSGVTSSFQKHSIPNYQRASFAAFLKLAKSQVQVDWPKTMDKFMDPVESDTTLGNRRNYLQELYLWLYIFNIFSAGCLSEAPSFISRGGPAGYHQWKDMPKVVAITLEVPRKNIAFYANGTNPLELGTPPVECSLRSIGPDATAWENNFVAIQLGFGKLSTSGIRNTESFKVNIADDPESWGGKSPLFASFYIPAWLLLQERNGVLVSFRLTTTPHTAGMYVSKLGLELKVFQASTEDKKHVYVSKDLPGLTTQLVPSVQTRQIDQTIVNATPSIKRSATASLTPCSSQISTITSRADIVDQATKKLLQSGCEVKTKMLSPFTCEISLGQSTRFSVGFPIAVSENTIKTRIARKSLYIELQAQITSDYRAPGPFKYPVIRSREGLVLWNMPRINLSRQAKLSTSNRKKLEWMSPHLAMMMSQRERFLRENKTAPRSNDEQLVLDMKESLFSLAMHFTGVQGVQGFCFGLDCREQRGTAIVILVSSARLDFSNRTIVLDAAIVPLTTAVRAAVGRSLFTVPNTIGIFVSPEELRLWKMLLPQWADRCRKAQHKPSCEYMASGQVPASFDKDQDFLCSCGKGDFPKSFQMKFAGWKELSKYATRAAISAITFSPLVEDIFTPDIPSGSRSGEGSKDVNIEAELMKHLEKQISSPEGFAKHMKKKYLGPNVNLPADFDVKATLESMKRHIPASTESHCHCCRKSKDALDSEQDLMRCTGCKKVSYCSKECQKKDWKSHKVQCTK